jgi:organic hydroperoxide reductase OsmC/OhrA
MTTDHTYRAQVQWQLAPGESFTAQRYSRRHTLRFDGGAQVLGSAAPSNVPLPWSDPAGVDPEEAFVASLAACHMLWFLHLAARAGHTVTHYEDDACGTMARDANGKLWLSDVVLRPRTAFDGEAPDAAALAALHHRAHEECFIANSVRTHVRIEAT